jgi:hypothetical protein
MESDNSGRYPRSEAQRASLWPNPAVGSRASCAPHSSGDELIHLFGHGVGGRPSERLLKRIGMPTSDDTILRHLKRRTDGQRAETSVRIVGVDDWAWRKGHNYGTIVVDRCGSYAQGA